MFQGIPIGMVKSRLAPFKASKIASSVSQTYNKWYLKDFPWIKVRLISMLEEPQGTKQRATVALVSRKAPDMCVCFSSIGKLIYFSETMIHIYTFLKKAKPVQYMHHNSTIPKDWKLCQALCAKRVSRTYTESSPPLFVLGQNLGISYYFHRTKHHGWDCLSFLIISFSLHN